MKTKPTFTTIMARAAMTLFLSLLTTATTWATDFITDVMVIGGSKSEVDTLKSTYSKKGWTVIDQDLNAGCGSKSDYVYLLYKTAPDSDESAAFITDFYISTASGTAPEGIISNSRTYSLTPYDGGSHFKSVQGDLNSNAKGSDIHLYYTKSNYDNSAVKSITFNNTKSGAVGENGGTTGCDLNKGAGGDYIYMHTQYSEGWLITKNNAGDQCYIDGFEGPTAMITTITIPYKIGNATVIGLRMNFSAFKNLETMNLYKYALIDWMPSVRGCSKFKNVNQITSEGYFYKSNTLPDGITYVPGYAFAGTAIETLDMPNVTEVGINAFEGCNKLTSVNFGKAATIGLGAFSKINNKTTSGNQTTYNQTTITYPGLLSDWQWSSYEYSPNLVINCKDGSCGWCGDEYNASTMYKDACLYWVLKENDLTIDCIPLDDFYQNNAVKQQIKTHNWLTISDSSIEAISLNHVRSIQKKEFESMETLKSVFLNPTLYTIGDSAFYGCNNLSDLYFDGNKKQWDKVIKSDNWKNGAKNFTEHWRCTVTFDANGHGTAPSAQTNLWSNKDKVADTGALTASDYDFIGWYTDAACTTPWNVKNDIVPGDMTLYAYWIEKHELLANAGNSQNLANWNGTTCTVQLKGSTIYNDYRWNTLCLPFNLSSLKDTPLDGLSLMELDGANSFLKAGILTLSFKAAHSIEAGKPYLVRDGIYSIATKADWDAFTARVNAGDLKLNAKLIADITEPVTTKVNNYKGVFDGQGHTLTIAYGSEDSPVTDEFTAPFSRIDEATIKNLNVKGDIYTSAKYCSGLAGSAYLYSILNCTVGVAIHSAVKGEGHHGGLVALSQIINEISNCAFTGSLLGPSTTNCGGLVGEHDAYYSLEEGEEPDFLTIHQCLFNPVNITMDTSGSYTFCKDYNNNCYANYYTRTFGESQGTATSASGSDLVALLGGGWEVRNGQVVPKIEDISDDIVNLIFRNVTIDATAPTSVYTADRAACFIGSYDPMGITDVDRTTLFLGSNNTLHYPNAAITINAFKGRFQLAHALTDSSTGDVNGDKVLSVTDVSYLVSHILGTDEDNFVIANADIDGDGEISVNDVSALVGIILSGSSNAFNVVTNLDGIPITFYGGDSGTVR